MRGRTAVGVCTCMQGRLCGVHVRAPCALMIRACVCQRARPCLACVCGATNLHRTCMPACFLSFTLQSVVQAASACFLWVPSPLFNSNELACMSSLLPMPVIACLTALCVKASRLPHVTAAPCPVLSSNDTAPGTVCLRSNPRACSAS